MADRKHETRFMQVSARAWFDPPRDVSVPRHLVQVDALCEFVENAEFFGPVGPALLGREVGVEHFRHAPTENQVRRCLFKAQAIRVAPDPERDGRSAPVLVVVCTSSIGAFSALALTPHGEYAGVWLLPWLGTDVYILLGSKLANDGTWGAMRFAIAPPRVRRRDLVAELLGDPHLSTITKDRITEAVMNNVIPATNEERGSLYERILAQGRNEGRNEGRREVALKLLQSLDSVLDEPAINSLRRHVDAVDFGERLAAAVAASRR